MSHLLAPVHVRQTIMTTKAIIKTSSIALLLIAAYAIIFAVEAAKHL